MMRLVGMCREAPDYHLALTPYQLPAIRNTDEFQREPGSGFQSD